MLILYNIDVFTNLGLHPKNILRRRRCGMTGRELFLNVFILGLIIIIVLLLLRQQKGTLTILSIDCQCAIPKLGLVPNSDNQVYPLLFYEVTLHVYILSYFILKIKYIFQILKLKIKQRHTNVFLQIVSVLAPKLGLVPNS